MPRSEHHRLYVHIAWSTLGRVSAIAADRRAAIETHVLAACRWVGAEPIEVCAISDRVHVLVRVPASLAVQDLATRVQSNVSRILADTGRVVRWAPGFAAATVSPREVRRVRRLIAEAESGRATSDSSRTGRPGFGARRPGTRGAVELP